MLKLSKNENVWVTSDLHLGHDREFVWKERGFESIGDMDEALVQRFNAKVLPTDTVFILGDLTLGNLDAAKPYLEALNGNITVIRGNHDTDVRVEYYESLGWKVYDAIRLKWDKYSFFLCHYPTITTNLENEYLTQATLNLYGHTHQKSNFYNDNPWCYHVGVDSHNGFPVSMYQVLDDIRTKIDECKKFL